MPLRQIFTPGSPYIDRWAAQQRAALQMALSKRSQELYLRVLDIAGPVPTLQVFVNPGIAIPPGWAIATQGSDVVVTIRGTSNLEQWKAHFAGTWGRRYDDAPGTAYVHAFMDEVVINQLYPSVAGVLAGLPSPPSRIIVSGHSYGGALATLLALRLAKDGHGSKLDVTTFGSPRVLTTGLAVEAEWPHYNIMGEKDLVCHLPPPGSNLRMLIGSAAGSVMGALGIGGFGKFVGSKASTTPFNLPNWQHFGARIDLTDSGGLGPARLGDQEPTGSSLGRSIRSPTGGHFMDEYYWPKLALVRASPGDGLKEYQDLLTLGGQILALPSQEDGPTDWDSLKRGVFPSVVPNYFPGVPGVTVEDLGAADSVEIAVDTRRGNGSIRATTQGGATMSVWKYTARISWGSHSRSVSIHRSGPGTMDAARTDAFLWAQQYGHLFGNTTAGNPLVGQRYIGVPGAPCIEYVTVSDPSTLRNSQRFKTPGTVGCPYAVVGNTSRPSDVPWVSVSLTIRATSGVNSVRDVISILGQPDAVANFGGYDGSAPMPAGGTFSAQLTTYLNYILAGGAQSFGTMGRDFANAPNAPIQNYITQADGSVAIAAATGNWLDQEFIKLIGTKNPYFNREWQVTENGDGTFTLKGSRFAVSGGLPSGGQGYRTRRVDGTKYQVYYTYAESLSTFNPEDRIFISERKRANPFTPSRSSRRRRTPVK